MPTVIVRTIDPNGNGDFSSINAANTALKRYLEDTVERWECAGGEIGNGMVDFDGWSMDSTSKLQIVAVPRHGGKWANNYAACNWYGWSTSAFYVAEGTSNTIELDGLILNSNGSIAATANTFSGNSATVSAKNCFFIVYGAVNSSAVFGFAKVENCAIIRPANIGVGNGCYSRMSVSPSEFYNVTVLGFDKAFYGHATLPPVVKNCISQCANSSAGTFSSSSGYNVGRTGTTEPGSNNRYGTVAFRADPFGYTSAFLANTDTVAKGYGTNLTSIGISTDFEDGERPSIGSWDIGCDQFNPTMSLQVAFPNFFKLDVKFPAERVTVTVKPDGGGDYLTLNAAIVAESTDLDYERKILTIECYSGINPLVTDNLEWSGSANEECYLHVKAMGDLRFNGEWDNSKFSIELVDEYRYLYFPSFAILDGFQIYTHASSEFASYVWGGYIEDGVLLNCGEKLLSENESATVYSVYAPHKYNCFVFNAGSFTVYEYESTYKAHCTSKGVRVFDTQAANSLYIDCDETIEYGMCVYTEADFGTSAIFQTSAPGDARLLPEYSTFLSIKNLDVVWASPFIKSIYNDVVGTNRQEFYCVGLYEPYNPGRFSMAQSIDTLLTAALRQVTPLACEFYALVDLSLYGKLYTAIKNTMEVSVNLSADMLSVARLFAQFRCNSQIVYMKLKAISKLAVSFGLEKEFAFVCKLLKMLSVDFSIDASLSKVISKLYVFLSSHFSSSVTFVQDFTLLLQQLKALDFSAATKMEIDRVILRLKSGGIYTPIPISGVPQYSLIMQQYSGTLHDIVIENSQDTTGTISIEMRV